jgi:hypothetical protein
MIIQSQQSTYGTDQISAVQKKRLSAEPLHLVHQQARCIDGPRDSVDSGCVASQR